MLRTTRPQNPQFNGSVCISKYARTTIVAVVVVATVVGLAAEVSVVVVVDVFVLVAVAQGTGRERQLHAELIAEQAKPLMGALVQVVVRFDRALKGAGEGWRARCAFGAAARVGSANVKARPRRLGLKQRVVVLCWVSEWLRDLAFGGHKVTYLVVVAVLV